MNDYIPIHVCDDVIEQSIFQGQLIDQDEFEDISRVATMDNHVPLHICDDTIPQDISYNDMVNRIFRRRASELNIPMNELIQGQYKR